MSYEKITVRHDDDGVSLITINRPERRNSICRVTALELQLAFAEFERMDSQRAAVLTGAGDDAFSAGADVTDLPELWRCVPTVGITTEKPIIGAIGGWCVGGALVVAMMCDLLVAAENAKFSYPEAKLGFTGGMIAGLASRIPHHAAMELILLCKTLKADRAHALGFVNEVVETGKQVDAAMTMARQLAGYAPLVLKTLKRFVTEGVLAQGPSETMARATRDLAVVRESADANEGKASFKERRPPRYSGR